MDVLQLPDEFRLVPKVAIVIALLPESTFGFSMIGLAREGQFEKVHRGGEVFVSGSETRR